MPDAYPGHGRLFAGALPAGVAVLLGAFSQCLAQSSPDFHSCTIGAGGGWASPQADSGLTRGWDFQAGGGFAVVAPSTGRWSVFLTANFMFDHLGATAAALSQATSANPMLAGATAAAAKFYSTTFDPEFRYAIGRRASVYFLGGFGWLRRNIEFTGAAAQGSLLQPSGPAVFAGGGNSGMYDAGGGLNVSPPRMGGVMLYLEVRYLHGLAINNATRLAPVTIGVRW